MNTPKSRSARDALTVLKTALSADKPDPQTIRAAIENADRFTVVHCHLDVLSFEDVGKLVELICLTEAACIALGDTLDADTYSTRREELAEEFMLIKQMRAASTALKSVERIIMPPRTGPKSSKGPKIKTDRVLSAGYGAISDHLRNLREKLRGKDEDD